MAAAFSVFTKISGEDGLSELFRKVAGSAKAAKAPIDSFNKAVSQPDTTALGRLGLKVDGVAGKFRTGLGSITSWLPALGALGSIGTLGGLIAMTHHAAEGYEGLTLAAKKLGASTADVALWRFGAKLANVETQALEKGLVMLNRRMYDAATGKNKDVAALFAAMKIPLRNAKGAVNGVSESLGDIAEAFKNTGNASTREAMAIALFGKSGADLLPFLMKGKEGLAELREEMKKYSGLNDQGRHDLEELAESYKKLDKAGSGLSTRLSAVVAPAMTRVVQGTTDWIVANREVLAQSLDRKLHRIGQAFDLVSSAAKKIAGLPFIAEFLKGTDAGTAFDVALGVLGLTMVGPLFAALQMIIGAVWSMNAALLANPFVLVGVAVAAAAYAIYANWGAIKGWFNDQMDAISAAFDRGFGSGLLEIFARFNPQTLIMTAINGLVKWLFGIDLFDAGAKLMQRLLDGIKSLLPDLTPIFDKVDRVMKWAGGASSSVAAAAAYEAGAGNIYDPTSIYAPSAAPSPGDVATAKAEKSTVEVKVDFTNMPQGAKADVKSSGAAQTETTVGRSMGGAF